MSENIIPDLRPLKKLEDAGVCVSLLKGRAGSEHAAWPSLMHAQLACLEAFNLLHQGGAEPLAALTFSDPAARWSASLLISPQMAFLSPVPEAHLAVVARTMHDRVLMENEGGLRIVTERGQAEKLAPIWQALTHQPVQTISRFDQYHCPSSSELMQMMPHRHAVEIVQAGPSDIPTVFEHENMLRSGLFERFPAWMQDAERDQLLRDMEGRPRYLCRDETGQITGHFITVPIGQRGSYIVSYVEPHRLFPPAESSVVADIHLAALTRTLQQEGRWVSLLAAPSLSLSLLAQSAKRLGFQEQGQSHCGYYPFSKGKLALTPR